MSIKYCLLILMFAVAHLGYANERLWLNATINGKPVHLCFDSGSDANAITPKTLEYIGLKFIPAPKNDFSPGVLAGDTEKCTVTSGARDPLSSCPSDGQ